MSTPGFLSTSPLPWPTRIPRVRAYGSGSNRPRWRVGPNDGARLLYRSISAASKPRLAGRRGVAASDVANYLQAFDVVLDAKDLPGVLLAAKPMANRLHRLVSVEEEGFVNARAALRAFDVGLARLLESRKT